jgi:hypothetical protein
MKLQFEPNGQVLFRVGFEFWSPARWRLDSAVSELRITIPRLRTDQIAPFEEDASHGFIKAFDPATKTVIYRFTDSTDVLTFAGLVYTRDAADAPGRAKAPVDEAGPPNMRLKLTGAAFKGSVRLGANELVQQGRVLAPACGRPAA